METDAYHPQRARRYGEIIGGPYVLDDNFNTAVCLVKFAGVQPGFIASISEVDFAEAGINAATHTRFTAEVDTAATHSNWLDPSGILPISDQFRPRFRR